MLLDGLEERLDVPCDVLDNVDNLEAAEGDALLFDEVRGDVHVEVLVDGLLLDVPEEGLGVHRDVLVDVLEDEEIDVLLDVLQDMVVVVAAQTCLHCLQQVA